MQYRTQKSLRLRFIILFTTPKMKRTKESGASFRKRKKTREEELKKNEGALLKFVVCEQSGQGNETIRTVTTSDEAENVPSSCASESIDNYTKMNEINRRLEEVDVTDKKKTTDEESNIFSGSQSDIESEIVQIGGEKLGVGEVMAEKDEGEPENNVCDEGAHVINMSGSLQCLPDDVADWPTVINQTFRLELVKAGPERFQNIEGPFGSILRQTRLKNDTIQAERWRSFSKEWFYKKLKNGETVLRTWLLYSKVEIGLYCFCCKLFRVGNTSSPFTSKCFDNFWHLNPCLFQHEDSKTHRDCMDKWKELLMRVGKKETIDKHLLAEIDAETDKWKNILHGVLDVIIFLSKQGLPFRGHREGFDSRNQGNFLETIKLIAKYNPMISQHLSNIQLSQKWMTTYLSPMIQNEIITLLADNVKKLIIKEVKEARYFSILFDSTPDISHVDQMAFVIRYVKIKNQEVEVKEMFLKFFPLYGKKAEEITTSILEELQENDLNVMMCRGQGYDNASTMAGIHTGVQRRIRDINPKAIFVPCSNHSLNLAGVHAVGSSVLSENFFALVERIFTFFSASTNRWNILTQNVPIVVKRVIETRWSAHYDAVKALQVGHDGVINALEQLCEHTENLDTRGAARSILDEIQSFSFLSFLHFWKQILQECNDVQKYFQQKGLSLEHCANRMKAFVAFLTEEREAIVKRCIDSAIQICEEQGIPVERRIRRRKRMPGEQALDAGLSFAEEIRRCILVAMDRFLMEATERFNVMQELNDIFSFLNPNILLHGEDIEEQMIAFKNLYKDEIDCAELVTEIPRFRRLIEASGHSFQQDDTSLDVLQCLIKYHLQESVPYLVLSIRIYLTITVSIASCERCFSKLKIIKSYLRSTMLEERLSSLALLSIESESVEKLDLVNIISEFASAKARRAQIK